jgi:cadmium resistance protein CadD (predicted permease)
MWAGGVNLPWNLAIAAIIGLTLLFTRVTFDAVGTMAHADHVIGFLALTVVSLAAAEVARPVRYLLVPLGGALFVTPFAFGASETHMIASFVAGAGLIALAFRRGKIGERYGSWDRWIV